MTKDGAPGVARDAHTQWRAASAVRAGCESDTLDELLLLLAQHERNSSVARSASVVSVAQAEAELAWIEASKRLNSKRKTAAKKALREKVLYHVRAAEDAAQIAAFEDDLPPLAPQPASQHANADQCTALDTELSLLASPSPSLQPLLAQLSSEGTPKLGTRI